MPTLSNGIVYQDLGTRDANEMAEYERKERERRRQTQQNTTPMSQPASQPNGIPRTVPDLGPVVTEVETTTGNGGQQAAPAAPRVRSNVGADPFAAAVQNRAAQDRNLGREDADVAYSQWKDNVGAAFSNGQAAARDKNKGVYSAGYTLWNTIDAINNGEFDLNDENDKKRAQFMVQQAASQFGSVVAENHGWTLVDGDGGQGFSGFDGKNFNFYFKDRNGNTISKSMSPETLRKTLEKQGLVDKADDDPTKKVSTTELDAKYFKNGWSDDTAMSIVEDKTLPAEYRTYVRKRLYDNMVSQAVKDAEARWTQEMDKKYAASVANAQAQNSYNAALARGVITQETRNDGRPQMGSGEGAAGNDTNVAPVVNVSDAAAVASGESRAPEFTPMPEDPRGSFYDSDAYKDALARFNEDWARRARGADLDEKKSGNDGNLAKAWGAGEGGINGDVETDPEVIELRRREQNGTLSASAAKRLAELTGGGSSDETEARPANEAESVSEPAAEPEPEVPESVREARARAQAAREAANASRVRAASAEKEASDILKGRGITSVDEAEVWDKKTGSYRPVIQNQRTRNLEPGQEIRNGRIIDVDGTDIGDADELIRNLPSSATQESEPVSQASTEEPSTPAEEPVAEQEPTPEQSEEPVSETTEEPAPHPAETEPEAEEEKTQSSGETAPEATQSAPQKQVAPSQYELRIRAKNVERIGRAIEDGRPVSDDERAYYELYGKPVSKGRVEWKNLGRVHKAKADEQTIRNQDVDRSLKKWRAMTSGINVNNPDTAPIVQRMRDQFVKQYGTTPEALERARNGETFAKFADVDRQTSGRVSEELKDESGVTVRRKQNAGNEQVFADKAMEIVHSADGKGEKRAMSMLREYYKLRVNDRGGSAISPKQQFINKYGVDPDVLENVLFDRT